MAKYTDMRTTFVKEILRQLCHPVTGITKKLSPSPVTLDDWNKCLLSVYGWVNVEINEKTANILHELKIGEVIPSSSANMNIYTYGFATVEIEKILVLEGKKDYRAILNYYSFSRLINILLNAREIEYKNKFNNSLNLIFNNINPKTFWINILVTEKTADYLKANEIGEIIVKEGLDNNNNIIKAPQNLQEIKRPPTVWEYNPDDVSCKDDIKQCANVEDDIIYNNDTNQCKDIDEDYTEQCYDINEDNDENIQQIHYRLIMNNTSFLKLINSTYNVNNSMYKNVNFFQLIGGESEDFSGLFGKMQI
jgi:hypothetical protein